MTRVRFLVPLVLCALGLLLATSASALPRLSYGDANYYASVALHRNFKGSFDAGYNKKIACGRRLGYSSRQCPHVSWIVGDLDFAGWVRIWLNRQGGNVWWNYAYTIHRFDEYCLTVQQRPPSECISTFHKD